MQIFTHRIDLFLISISKDTYFFVYFLKCPSLCSDFMNNRNLVFAVDGIFNNVFAYVFVTFYAISEIF